MGPDATDRTVNASVPFGVGTVVAATYEVTALLGQGGMGAVFLARHLRLPGKRVALKVLHQGGKDGEAYARFRREAEIVSRIGHPNIIEVLDFNTLPDGTPYLVLEFLAGESLGARVGRGPLETDAALGLLRQMGSALQAAHRAGVVHRDMKPENVFLCPTDAGGVIHERVKVLDFGISKIRGSQTVMTQESVLIGTPQYMAPEQALGRNQDIDARADQFALACILYEMLAGRPPFSGDSLAAVIYAIVHQPHVPLATMVPGLPRAVSAAVDRALAKARDDRFADIGAFVEGVTGRPLETLRGADGAAAAGGAQPARAGVATDPLAATNASQPGAPPPAAAAGGTMPAVAAGAIAPVTPASTTEKTVRRSPVAAVVAAALALVAIGGGAVWYLGRQSAPVPIARTPDPIPPAQVDKPPVKVVAADPDPVPSPREAGTGAGTGAGRGAEASKRGAAHADTTAVAPAAAEEIAQAEEALAQGNAADAIRLAQHSLYLGKSTRAFAIIVKARCRQSDLGGARAALAQIAAGQRAAVLRDCAAHGMDLR